jgi:hypothetical protein
VSASNLPEWSPFSQQRYWLHAEISERRHTCSTDVIGTSYRSRDHRSPRQLEAPPSFSSWSIRFRRARQLITTQPTQRVPEWTRHSKTPCDDVGQNSPMLCSDRRAAGVRVNTSRRLNWSLPHPTSAVDTCRPKVLGR